MRLRSVATAIAVTFLVLVVAAVAWMNAQPMDPAELADRCRQALPTWPNYDEDIKAQIGARPFAEWKGEPVMAYRDEDGLVLAFIVGGPWAQYEAAMPVLIRDALGAVQRDRDWYRDGHHVVYRFPTEDDSAALALDLIEVRYPHYTRRLIVIDQTQPAE